MKTDLSMFEQFGKKSAVSTRPTNSNCVIYTRVSSKEQADNNLSLDTQLKYCNEYAELNGYSVMGRFGGTYESAKTDERKEFNKMLAFIRNKAEKVSYIIIYSFDRFSRTGANGIYIKENLKKQGIILQSVTQPTDGNTSSGAFQQNIQFVFSEYDNAQRKEKCMVGVKEALLQGRWCHHAPIGYEIVKRDGVSKLMINEQGKFVKMAFLWKEEGCSMEEIRKRLAKMGFAKNHQTISYILRNPFYCGVISHNALEGKVVEGTQEKLISKELFLKVNNILSANTAGFTVKHENDYLPLKNFIKCDNCGSNIPGYIVKHANAWYYKCRKKGCCNNKSAISLHQRFKETLSSFTIEDKYREVIKTQMLETYKNLSKDAVDNTAILNKQLTDLQIKIDRLEERFVEEEITKEMFNKFTAKFKQEIKEIQTEISKTQKTVSNPVDCVEQAMNFANKLPKMWDLANYQDKQRLQYLLFPDGIYYNKKNDSCRTENINAVFLSISLLSRDLSGDDSGFLPLNMCHSSLVTLSGVEVSSVG